MKRCKDKCDTCKLWNEFCIGYAHISEEECVKKNYAMYRPKFTKKIKQIWKDFCNAWREKRCKDCTWERPCKEYTRLYNVGFYVDCGGHIEKCEGYAPTNRKKVKNVLSGIIAGLWVGIKKYGSLRR